MDIIMRVNHTKASCQAEAETTCFSVQTGNAIRTANWEFFYNSIDGFEFEEGYVQTLKVRITTVSNPPADASNLKYTLLEVLSKEPAL